MPRLRRVARMCSSTLSVNCEYFTKQTQEYPDCRSPISERSHVGNLRQTKKQRETGVKRVETAGVYPLAPPRGAARSRRGGGESPRSAERNSPLRFSKKRLPPGQGEPPARFKYPAGSVQKRSRPVRANTLTQFTHPAQPVQRKRLPPVRGEPLMRFVYPAQPVPHREKNDFYIKKSAETRSD